MYKTIKVTRCIITFSVLFVAFNLFANDETLNVKIQKIKSQKDDTNKVITLNKMALEVAQSDHELGKKLAFQALSLSKKLDYKRGIGSSYLSVARALNEAHNATHAHFYLDKALAIFSTINDKNNKALCYAERGSIYYSEGKSSECLEALNTSIEISTTDQIVLAKIYNYMGATYGNLGDYPKSLPYFLKTLKIWEKKKNDKYIAYAYLNIGFTYSKQKNYVLAKKYFDRLTNISKKLKDPFFISMSYTLIANTFNETNQYDKALFYHQKSLEIKLPLNDKIRLSESYIDIGDILFKQKKYKEAERNFKIALQLVIEDKDEIGIGTTLYSLGKLYTQINKFDLAEKYLLQSLKILKKAKVNDYIRECYQYLYKLYEKKHNYKKAFDYYNLYSIYSDSVHNEENTAKTIQTEMQYEFDKKTTADSIQNIEKQKVKDAQIEVANLKLKREKSQFIYLTIGLIIVVLVLIIVVNRFKITKKQKAIIEKQKSQIVESIHYSKKIQDALLPEVTEIAKTIPTVFIYYQPKDIVSGDFYWYKKIENYSIIACVDCTGHGVPGAFMSTIGSLALDKITRPESLTPSVILSDLNNEIIHILRQQSDGELQDGMDLSVCIIDHQKKQISYSGARNGIIIVSQGLAVRYKADLLPVGGNYMKKGKPIIREFTNHVIDISESDWIFMYTDGFVEQIGGKDNLPMNFQQYEKILISIASNKNGEKTEVLNSEFNKWKGGNECTDDVLIIGFQI